MIPELLPYHSFDPDGNVFVQEDGSLGLAWTLSPIECELLSETARGQLSRRVESLLALFPEGSAVQFILTSRRKVDLRPWLDATTEGGCFAISPNRESGRPRRSRFRTKEP